MFYVPDNYLFRQIEKPALKIIRKYTEQIKKINKINNINTQERSKQSSDNRSYHLRYKTVEQRPTKQKKRPLMSRFKKLPIILPVLDQKIFLKGKEVVKNYHKDMSQRKLFLEYDQSDRHSHQKTVITQIKKTDKHEAIQYTQIQVEPWGISD